MFERITIEASSGRIYFWEVITITYSDFAIFVVTCVISQTKIAELTSTSIGLRRPDPISCRKWDVSYFMTLKKNITNFYVAYAAIYSNNTLTDECWK